MVWPGIWHADVSRPPSELIKLWSCSVDFAVSGHYLKNAWEEWPQI